jgi:hypothetical protein
MRMQGIALVLASFIISIQAYGYSGILYEQNSGKKKQLFTMNVDLGKNEEGQETAKVTYKDNDGNLALEENIILDGSKVIRDEAIQKQLNQVGLMEVKDGKIFFSKTEDGKTSTKEEKLEEPFVTSANFQRFVRDHWEP